MPHPPFTLAVLISGSGSNLQAIIDGCNNGTIAAKIGLVVSDNNQAFGLERASENNISTAVVERKNYTSTDAFDHALISTVQPIKPDLIVLAGFMRILGEAFIEAFAERIVNIHPSLLPQYRGLNTHQRAIDGNEKWHGATVHYVTQRLDDGPIIVQARVMIDPQDTAETLQKKVLTQEHIIYPQAIQSIVTGAIDFQHPRLMDSAASVRGATFA